MQISYLYISSNRTRFYLQMDYARELNWDLHWVRTTVSEKVIQSVRLSAHSKEAQWVSEMAVLIDKRCSFFLCARAEGLTRSD